jgi:hypothetical protein
MSPELDVQHDCTAIARRLATADFPWDTTRALELALFRTFASIARADYPGGYRIESLGPPPSS